MARDPRAGEVRPWPALALVLLLAGSGGWLARGADEEPRPPAPPYRRLPSYFGQIGLSDDQRQRVYLIRGRYRAEIAALTARLDQLRQDEKKGCEDVLTDTQKRLLEQARARARATRARAATKPPGPS